MPTITPCWKTFKPRIYQQIAPRSPRSVRLITITRQRYLRFTCNCPVIAFIKNLTYFPLSNDQGNRHEPNEHRDQQTLSGAGKLLLSILCSALSLGAWQAATAAVPQDTLVIGKPADPQTLDPAVTFDNNDWTITYPSYQRLVGYKVEGDKSSTEVQGDLAESWTVSRTIWSGNSKSNLATNLTTVPL